MIVLDCEQRTTEWYEARIGVITASACADMMSNYKRKAFVYKKLAEIMTGEAESFEPNKYMQWGIDTEDQAREAYEAATGLKVKEVGFIFKDEDRLVACSPDGLVGEDGLVEIKCPMTKTHLNYINSGPPKMYVDQMQFQMYCTGRQWCDFYCYDPRVKQDDLKGYLKRVKRDPLKMLEIDAAVTWTVGEINKFKDKHNVNR